jgi:5-hydroxyisourate hydrolase
MSPITSHVLDTAAGKPASGIVVLIEIGQGPDRWVELARGVTDGDGRVGQFAPPLVPLHPGIYRLRFLTAAYFASAGAHGFYPEVNVIVQIDDPAQHYHIPLLLSPFGFTTYRGR